MPLVKEDELPLAVVDGGLAVQLGHIGELTATLWPLHPYCLQQLAEALRRPATHVTLCPEGRQEEMMEEEEEEIGRENMVEELEKWSGDKVEKKEREGRKMKRRRWR